MKLAPQASAVAVKTVGVRDLRSDLATYLRAASRGDHFVITHSGEPIAELVPVGGPVGGGAASTGTVSLGALAASGLLEPPATTPSKQTAVHDLVQLPVGVSCASALADLRSTHTRRTRR